MAGLVPILRRRFLIVATPREQTLQKHPGRVGRVPAQFSLVTARQISDIFLSARQDPVAFPQGTFIASGNGRIIPLAPLHHLLEEENHGKEDETLF
jgi:hypothetical protein